MTHLQVNSSSPGFPHSPYPRLGSVGRDAAALELRQWETSHSQGFSAVVCSLPRRERLTHPLPAAPAATPRRGAVESDPSRGTTQLLGLAHDGKEAQGTEQQNSREGISPAAGKNRSNTPKSLSSILPTHGTTSPLRFQPGKKGAGKEKRKEGSRSSSQGTGTLQGTALDPAAPGTPASTQLVSRTFIFTLPAFSGNPKK